MSAALLAATPMDGGGRSDDVRSEFAALCAQAADADGLRSRVHARALDRIRDDESRQRIVGELADRLRSAELIEVREQDDRAIVRFRSSVDEAKDPEQRELVLAKQQGGGWLIEQPIAYLVSGAALDARQGKRPAVIRLIERTANGPYGASGFSFTHVTGDAAQCKNRMDVWLCHNDDLHIDPDGRIADLGKIPLSKADRIPLDTEWNRRTIRVRKGHTYVVHCVSSGRSNYFVKLRVKKFKRGVAELEWTLLTDGLGAPPTIHEANPIHSNDGADGTAGLCAKE